MHRIFKLIIIISVAAVSVVAGVFVFFPNVPETILNPDRIELVSARWGNMVNRSYEPEDARWINFTIYNHGEDKTSVEDAPIFKLEGYYYSDYTVIDMRKWKLQHGTNEIMMMVRSVTTNYRLLIDDEVLWEGNV